MRRRPTETRGAWSPVLRARRHEKTGDAPPTASEYVQVTLLAMLAAGLVLGVHWPALSAQAISMDDHQYLLENPLVQNPGWHSVHEFLTEVINPSTVEGYYQPLTMISLMLDWARGGRPDNLRPFHLTSLMLHAANTCLLLVLLFQLCRRVWPAAFAAVLFGVHPLTVEPIAWIGERKTVLASFLVLWSIIAYVLYSRHRSKLAYAASLTTFILALLAKPTATPLPLLLLILDFWPLDRLSRQAVVEKIPFFAVSAGSAILTIISQGQTVPLSVPHHQSMWQTALLVCHILMFYLHKMIWPANLSSVYPFPASLSLAQPQILLGIAGCAVLLAALLVSLKWSRCPLAASLFFIAALSPTMMNLGYSWTAAADKYVYLPMMGLALCLAHSLNGIWGRWPGNSTIIWRRLGIGAVFLVLLLAAGHATRRYLAIWHDSLRLHTHMESVAPDSAVVHLRLGDILFEQGQIEQSMKEYSRALDLMPDWPQAHLCLAMALLKKGEYQDAIAELNKCPHIRRLDHQKEYYLGCALQQTGQIEAAEAHYAEALRLRPGWTEPMNNLAWLMATHPSEQKDRAERAIALAEQACDRTAYRDPNFLDTLAAAYAAAGRFAPAVSTARKALALMTAQGSPEIEEQIRARLALYQAGQPYRESSMPTSVPSAPSRPSP